MSLVNAPFFKHIVQPHVLVYVDTADIVAAGEVRHTGSA